MLRKNIWIEFNQCPFFELVKPANELDGTEDSNQLWLVNWECKGIWIVTTMLLSLVIFRGLLLVLKDRFLFITHDNLSLKLRIIEIKRYCWILNIFVDP